MKTFMELETRIDRKKTIRMMKKEMEQLYYFGNSFVDHTQKLNVEESDASYLSYQPTFKETKENEQFMVQTEALTQELLQGIHRLPQKERILMEELYLLHNEKEEVCKKLKITSCTLRRRSQNALYHLAILLHKTIMLEE